MASDLQIAIYYAPETTYGVSPATGWKTLRKNAKDRFAGKAKTKRSGEVRADRNQVDLRRVGKDVNGGFDSGLSAGTFDDLMEAALGGTWTTNVLKVGSVSRSFSFEKVHRDIAAPNREYYKGMRVSSMKLDIKSEDFVGISFDFAGSDSSDGLVSTVLAATVSAPTTSETMAATSDFIASSTLLIDGAAAAACISAISLELNNNLDATSCVAKMGATDQSVGTCEIKTTLEIYLTAASVPLYNKAVTAKLPISVSITLKDSANKSYAFLIPRIFAPDTVKDGDKNITIKLSGEASFDTTTATSLQITRVP